MRDASCWVESETDTNQLYLMLDHGDGKWSVRRVNREDWREEANIAFCYSRDSALAVLRLMSSRTIQFVN